VVFCPDEKRGKRDKKQWLNDMLQCQADARKAAGWSAEKVAQALQYAKVPIPEFEAGTLHSAPSAPDRLVCSPSAITAVAVARLCAMAARLAVQICARSTRQEQQMLAPG
jgi:hypothetical protein